MVTLYLIPASSSQNLFDVFIVSVRAHGAAFTFLWLYPLLATVIFCGIYVLLRKIPVKAYQYTVLGSLFICMLFYFVGYILETRFIGMAIGCTASFFIIALVFFCGGPKDGSIT